MSDGTKKHLTDHSCNEMIRTAIRTIALKGVVNSSTGVVRGTARVTGYVAKIHTDESDELFGTIDVQEYADWTVPESEDAKIGYHEGVLLTAIQKDISGYVIIPKLYSDVLVCKDPATGNEYVTMFSHIDCIQLDSHQDISIGVREREEYKLDDEDAPDIHELALTGVQTNTSYTKNSVVTTIKTESGKGEAAVTHALGKTKDGVLAKTDVGGKSTMTMTAESIVQEHDKAKVTLDGFQSKIEMGSSSVTVRDGTTYVGSESGVDDAVLGQQLASILSDLVGYLGQMMTPTMMGPQPPANMLASFISLQAKIKAFASSHSGFLTKKVQIQK
jgi:hypothetical protein